MIVSIKLNRFIPCNIIIMYVGRVYKAGFRLKPIHNKNIPDIVHGVGY